VELHLNPDIAILLISVGLTLCILEAGLSFQETEGKFLPHFFPYNFYVDLNINLFRE
jgi:hypothetical protein